MECSAEYPVVRGIPVLLDPDADEVSNLVKDFYASGWERGDRGALKAREVHEDLSESGQRYIKTNEDLFLPFLKESPSEFFLDVGCGAQPRVDFGINSSRHICLDLSLEGLLEARNVLGERAICICGSILRMPLRDSVVNQAIASHTLYHIDRDLQPKAISEISRVLGTGSRGLIFYVNPDSPERRFYASIVAVGRWVKGLFGQASAVPRSPLYYSPHSISSMMGFLGASFPDSTVTVHTLRTLIKRTSKPLLGLPVVGKLMLRVLLRVDTALRNQPGAASYVTYQIQ